MNKDELDRIRQWFDALEDVNPEFLEPTDYELAAKIYKLLGKDVPPRIRVKADGST